MSKLLSIGITILLLPILIPLGIYVGLTYHWTDTVPKEEGDE